MKNSSRFSCVLLGFRNRAARTGALLLFIVSLTLYPACPAPTGSATPDESGGTLVYPRYLHTATRLTDGRVLLIAGVVQSIGTSVLCEFYDPVRNSWRATGSLNQARYNHRSVLLSDGRVLAISGEDASTNALTSAEIYDPTAGTWSFTGSLSLGRAQGCEAVLLPNGKVLVSGGYNAFTGGALTSCELYDPASGLWSSTGNLLQPHSSHHATLLADGKVLIAGGYTNAGPTGDAELYDPSAGTWSTTSSLPLARASNIQVLLADGRVLVAGGFVLQGRTYKATRNCEIYDPASGLWSRTDNLTAPRGGMTANLLIDGRVFITGGTDLVNGSLDTVEEFDTSSGRWRLLATTLSSPRSSHTATNLLDGSVIVAGGIDNSYQLVPIADLFVRPR